MSRPFGLSTIQTRKVVIENILTHTCVCPSRTWVQHRGFAQYEEQEVWWGLGPRALWAEARCWMDGDRSGGSSPDDVAPVSWVSKNARAVLLTHKRSFRLWTKKWSAHSQHQTIQKAENYAHEVLANVIRWHFIQQGIHSTATCPWGAAPTCRWGARCCCAMLENKKIEVGHYPVVRSVCIAGIDAIIALVEVGYGGLRHFSA